ncbi:hypothetical protein [Comamonas sp. JC664]|uniref:hypothetical protein n=1 Tax=Comamonas sp. JC664 TaxID=2801917 RepID=UPI00174B1E75|nr:hypothetical protein [Comamonas sp. JC664]MBL0693143.1 hypothetical protein [Comamonas sp. JC664]GHG96994.1 hypothetical protein GCM10012319_61630 [Comamonas sp. KCTC 72670]
MSAGKIIVELGKIIGGGVAYDVIKEGAKAVKDKAWEGHDPNKRPSPQPAPTRPKPPEKAPPAKAPVAGPRPKPR